MEKTETLMIKAIGCILLICTLPALVVALIAEISSGSPALYIRLPLMISPLFFLLSGIGILMLKNWARLLAIITLLATSATLLFTAYGNMEILSIHSEFAPSNKPFALKLIAVSLLFVFIAIYFTRPKVKEQFK